MLAYNAHTGANCYTDTKGNAFFLAPSPDVSDYRKKQVDVEKEKSCTVLEEITKLMLRKRGPVQF